MENISSRNQRCKPNRANSYRDRPSISKKANCFPLTGEELRGLHPVNRLGFDIIESRDIARILCSSGVSPKPSIIFNKTYRNRILEGRTLKRITLADRSVIGPLVLSVSDKILTDIDARITLRTRAGYILKVKRNQISYIQSAHNQGFSPSIILTELKRIKLTPIEQLLTRNSSRVTVQIPEEKADLSGISYSLSENAVSAAERLIHPANQVMGEITSHSVLNPEAMRKMNGQQRIDYVVKTIEHYATTNRYYRPYAMLTKSERAWLSSQGLVRGRHRLPGPIINITAHPIVNIVAHFLRQQLESVLKYVPSSVKSEDPQRYVSLDLYFVRQKLKDDPLKNHVDDVVGLQQEWIRIEEMVRRNSAHTSVLQPRVAARAQIPPPGPRIMSLSQFQHRYYDSAFHILSERFADTPGLTLKDVSEFKSIVSIFERLNGFPKIGPHAATIHAFLSRAKSQIIRNLITCDD